MKLQDFKVQATVLFFLELLAVLGTLCFSLPNKVMEINEVDVLPIAKQFVNPNWMSTDWYLNQPPGYRLLFQSIFGRLIDSLGFLYGAMVGRLFCYTLVALGIVLISRRLQINRLLLVFSVFLFLYPSDYRTFVERIVAKVPVTGFDLRFFAFAIIATATGLAVYLWMRSRSVLALVYPMLLIVCGLFLLAANPGQGMVAKEAIVLDLEAKTVAYGFVVLALAALLWQRYRMMAIALGIATSFHVLVGGYAFFSAFLTIIWVLKSERLHLRDLARKLLLITGLYIVCSAFAIQPVIDQIFASEPSGEISYSYIYVFLRLPHHLNPTNWKAEWWVTLVSYFLILIISFSITVLYRVKNNVSNKPPETILLVFTFMSLVPFMAGLLVAPFDSTGGLLKYYPFRLGDVILPFSACLLFAAALSRSFQGKWKQLFLYFLCTVLTVWCVGKLRLGGLNEAWVSLQSFPVAENQRSDLYQWVRAHTSPEAQIITSPGDLDEFSWVTERSTIAKLKFLPQTQQGIIEWNQRLQDLNGGRSVWPQTISRDYNVWLDVGQPLSENYSKLTPEQVLHLMDKYHSQYFITSRTHFLNGFKVVYTNENYIVYGKNSDRQPD